MAIKPPRGRPRNQEARLEVLKAARQLMAEGGIAAVTIEELSARTGVGRPTIYRSWPNAKAVAMAALMEAAPLPTRGSARRSTRAELRQVMRELVAAFATPGGRSAAVLIAAADQSTELAKAFRHHVLLKSRERVLDALRNGVARDELRARIDLEVAADLVMAPVFFRLLIGHQPLSADFADAVVDQALDGLKP
jgi:AcrR family transcriptional regulator